MVRLNNIMATVAVSFVDMWAWHEDEISTLHTSGTEISHWLKNGLAQIHHSGIVQFFHDKELLRDNR